jgi:hypothetical protein
MLELFPEGFAEVAGAEATELIAFTDDTGAARLRATFDDVRVEPVPEGWERDWMRFHRPVELGSLWIGPPWESRDPGLVAIVIDPRARVRTVAHPTDAALSRSAPVPRFGPASSTVGCGRRARDAACKLGFVAVAVIDAGRCRPSRRPGATPPERSQWTVGPRRDERRAPGGRDGRREHRFRTIERLRLS